MRSWYPPSRVIVRANNGGGLACWGKCPPSAETLAVYVAGPIGKLMHDPHSCPGWDGDVEYSLGVLHRIEGGQEAAVRNACKRARAILDAEWGAVTAIANELEAKGSVTGGRIKELISTAAKRKPPTGKERKLERKVEDAGTLKIGGTATLYDTLTKDADTRGFAFNFRRGAFGSFLKKSPDVAVQSHHNEERIVARTLNGSARFWDTPTGVNFEANLANTQAGRDLYYEIKTGLLAEMSIGFNLPSREDAQWTVNDDGIAVFEVNRGTFDEASILREGAMPKTSVRSLRAGEVSGAEGTNNGEVRRRFEERQREIKAAALPTGCASSFARLDKMVSEWKREESEKERTAYIDRKVREMQEARETSDYTRQRGWQSPLSPRH